MVDTPQTLASRLITTQWVTKVNVTTAFTLRATTSDLQRVSPVPNVAAITTNNIRITTSTAANSLAMFNFHCTSDLRERKKSKFNGLRLAVRRHVIGRHVQADIIN